MYKDSDLGSDSDKWSHLMLMFIENSKSDLPTTRTIRESDRQCLIFAKVTGQCRLEDVLRTHVGVVGRVDTGALLRVS